MYKISDKNSKSKTFGCQKFVYAQHSNTSTNRTKKSPQTTKPKDLIEKRKKFL